MMKVAKILTNDLFNGPGLRVSFWVQGCTHGCKNCHNKTLWDFKYGKEMNNDILLSINKEISKGQNLSILGGEPLEKCNHEDLEIMLRSLKNENKDLNIWLWTGYSWDQIKDLSFIHYIDVIVDGKFIQELKVNENTKCWKDKYRGSINQNIIDVKKSLKLNRMFEYECF